MAQGSRIQVPPDTSFGAGLAFGLSLAGLFLCFLSFGYLMIGSDNWGDPDLLSMGNIAGLAAALCGLAVVVLSIIGFLKSGARWRRRIAFVIAGLIGSLELGFFLFLVLPDWLEHTPQR